MSEQNEKIFDSPASEPEDEFWLEHGRQMISESLPAIRGAANALITVLGIIIGIYLGVLLSISESLFKTTWSFIDLLLVAPLLLWLISLYCCLDVVMTKKLQLFLYSPDDIRDKSIRFIRKKQRLLRWGYWLLAGGLALVIAGFIVRIAHS